MSTEAIALPHWGNVVPCVQRLMRIYNDKALLAAKTEAVHAASRGGIVTGSGLSRPELCRVLSAIWKFDYMGSAEFEWGQQVEAIESMREHNLDPECDSLVTAAVDVTFEPCPYGGKLGETMTSAARDRFNRSFSNVPVTAPVYLICFGSHVEPLTALIRRFAVLDHDVRCKEDLRMWKSYMSTEPDGYPDIVGWLELYTGWLAFKDKRTFELTCLAMGLD